MSESRWNVYVTDEGVRGRTGSFRFRWRARMEMHSKLRYWPEPKTVELVRETDGVPIMFVGIEGCPYCEIDKDWSNYPEWFESMKSWHEDGHPIPDPKERIFKGSANAI